MTKRERDKLRGREREVWSSTYARTFERELKKRLEPGVRFDREVETSARSALGKADLAVEGMRRAESENA